MLPRLQRLRLLLDDDHDLLLVAYDLYNNLMCSCPGYLMVWWCCLYC